MPDVSLSGIEFKIKGSSDAASGSIQKLIKDLGELKEALKSSQGINGLANALKKFENVNSTMLFVAKEALEGISKIDFSNIQQAADGIRDIATAARAIANIGKGKENPVEQITGGGGGQPFYYNAFDYLAVGAKQLWHMLERVGGAIAPVVSGFIQLRNMAIKGAFSAMLAPLKVATKNMGSMAKSVSGVVAGFKRIAFYRILRSVIKEITQGFSEGVKNLYGWSSAFGGAMIAGKNFKETMDGIATSTMYLKNSIGAAAAPFISALAPAIDYVIDKAVALLNVINQLMALFSGATSWNRAIKKTQEYGDAVGGAGGAAKEALKYLAPFDELNRLPDDKNGGGGGGSGTDYSGMFEETTEFMEGLKDFADSLKEKVNAGDWQGVGVLIGEKINSIIDYLEDGNYFATAGAKIGEYINAWFTTRYWTLQTINFGHIGGDIATAFNNMIEQIDFDVVGRTITQKFTILGDLIVSAVNTINWEEVGDSIGDLIRGAFDQLSEWLEGIDWQTFGYNLYHDLLDVVQGIDFASVASSLMRLLGAAIGAATALIGTFVQEMWEDIKGYFEQYLPNGWDSTGGEIIAGIFQGITNALASVGTWVVTNVFQPLLNGIKSAFGIASPASTMISPGEEIANGILEGMLQPFRNIVSWVDEHIVQPIKDALKNFSLKDLIFGNDNDSGSSSGENWFSRIFGEGIQTEVEVTGIKDNIPLGQKIIDGVKGIFGSSDPSKLTTAQKTIDTISNWAATKLGLTDAQRTINTWSNWKATKNSLTNDQRTISTWSNWKLTKNSLTNDQRTIGTWSNWKATKNSLTDNQRTIGTWANFKAMLNNLSEGQRTFSSKANFNTWTDAIPYYSRPWIDTQAKFTSYSNALGTPTIDVQARISGSLGNYTMASGGVIEHGKFKSIPQAASGGQFHGTLFWAGENGAEVVGHAGGRTEVLNRSQLAATMYAAVRSAMSGVAFNVSAPTMGTGATDDGANEDMLYRAFLRALNDSDNEVEVNLDGNVIYRSVVQHNRQERKRMGINPMLSY